MTPSVEEQWVEAIRKNNELREQHKEVVKGDYGVVVVDGDNVPTIEKQVKDQVGVYLDEFNHDLDDLVKDGLTSPQFEALSRQEKEDQYVITWSGRTQREKNGDFVSALDGGAKGDGVTTDLNALKNASYLGGAQLLNKGKVFKFADGTEVQDLPSFDVLPLGEGKLKWKNTELGGYQFKLNILTESMYLTPSSWHRTARNELADFSKEYPPYPPQGTSNVIGNVYNLILSWRSNLNDLTKKVQQVTAIGANIGVDAQDWLLTDAYGQDAAMFCQLSERNAFFGSETAVWAGAPNRQYLINKNHDWYRNTPPNEWTSENSDLEKYNPGIGLELYEYEAYPKVKSEVSLNTFVGRDAGCHFLKGEGNLIAGYCAGFDLFAGSANIILGRNASRHNVFGNLNVVIGDNAGRYGAKYQQSVFIGALAAQQHTVGNNATVVGYHAARDTQDLTNAVVLGAYAGTEVASLRNKLFIGNVGNQTTPLLGGDFISKRVGIKVDVGEERADLHIRSSKINSTATFSGSLVEGVGTQNYAIDIPSDGFGQFIVVVNGVTKAGLLYGASSGNLQVYVDNAIQWRFMPSGELRPNTTNTKDIGSASYVVRSLHIQNSPIVSSDERLKQQFRSLHEAEKSAALAIKNSICMFRFNDAVDLKGDGARWHCGVKAQQVVSILESHGLNWQEYAFICFDEWEGQEEIVDDEGGITQDHREAGSRYAIRYDELSMFILSSI